MLSVAAVVGAALLWLGVLFAVALMAERRPTMLAAHWRHVYALSLAVYCTSWTFFGTVTQAGRYGWPLPPTFVGTIALYALAGAALMRLVELARASNATSIADLVATRLGKDPWLAAAVTAIAALGLTPYIALQLMAVASGFELMTGSGGNARVPWRDSALYVALAMAVFALVFGTRRASAAEHNRGLVLAMAFESLFKLAAMLALGLFVWLGLRLPAPEAVPVTSGDGFAPLVLLGGLAIITLPHQFHMGVVECRDAGHVRTARWLFPLYLLLIALPILALARAGQALLGGSVAPDLYVLALPMSQQAHGLALLAFLGGLSAATGMVVVATLSLSLMIGNHWLLPWLSRGWARAGSSDLRGAVLGTRRVVIVATMLLAWGYSRLVDGNAALADIGALSFSAMATLAPALAFAVWRPQTPPHAVLAGIVVAFLVWGWCLPLPLLLGDAVPPWIVQGPAGIGWLAPQQFFGLTGWSPLGRAVAGSLFLGTLATLLLAVRGRPVPGTGDPRGLDARTLRQLALRFLPAERVEALLDKAPPAGPVPQPTSAAIERELSAVLGAASVRVLLDAARHAAGRELDAVAAVVDETSQHLRFNERVLEAALQNMSQGISVVDADLRLVAWNRRYEELFGYPEGMLRVGMPIADASRWAMQRMPQEAMPLEMALQKRLAHMRAGTPHLTERVFPDGSIVEIRGNPMPGGGFVATFTDVTAFRAAEADLKRSNETLEQRVGERTASLEAAKRDAEHANDAKSRFLAAIGHDLLQPLHAAHLFTDALRQRSTDPDAQALSLQIGGALDSTTGLLTSLLDMSRLEAGGLVPEPRDVPLAEVLEPLVSEFRVMAADQGLALRSVPTRAWVRTDPQLLRRVLQNFLANALRYTTSGGVLLGVRREGGHLRIEVHDTGPGIDAVQRRAIFEEFRRGPDAPGQGLGLGLSIADRIAGLLEAPLSLRTRPGRGSCFAVSVARAKAVPQAQARRGTIAGLRVLAVDNEPQALAALATLLRGWECQVTAVADGDAALAAIRAQPADVWMLDYHLDHGDDGVSLYRRLSALAGPRPCLVLSADQTGQVRAATQEAGIPLVAKPLRPLALKSVLDRLLAARAAGR